RDSFVEINFDPQMGARTRNFPDQSVKLRQPLELLTKSVIMRRLESRSRGALLGSRPLRDILGVAGG
ncbi:MAG: hypothetical protein R3183_14305, partial [Oleiphilaceae bacterium]|nr:hypothetical protein [Oleiphilaceae bacterium]